MCTCFIAGSDIGSFAIPHVSHIFHVIVQDALPFLYVRLGYHIYKHLLSLYEVAGARYTRFERLNYSKGIDYDNIPFHRRDKRQVV